VREETAGQPHEAPRFDCAKIGLAAINDKEAVAKSFDRLIFFIFFIFKFIFSLRDKFMPRIWLLF
jgi:hypothetical protein